MLLAENGKIYTCKGKRYVACKGEDPLSCYNCAMYGKYEWQPCPNVIRNGKQYSCIDKKGRNGVIFKEVKKNEKQSGDNGT